MYRETPSQWRDIECMLHVDRETSVGKVLAEAGCAGQKPRLRPG